MRGNKTRSDGPSGKTWRFLVLTWFGADDVVRGNTIEEVGARDDDTIPWSNEPEIILTEAYHLKYEGKVMALSKRRPDAADRCVSGRLGSRPATWCRSWTGRPPESGAGLSQAIDPTAYLVDAAIPAGTETVSISTGFVGETYQENRIDVRGGRRFDARWCSPATISERAWSRTIFWGAEFAFRLTAFPTETPVMWGWSHTPYLGG